MDKSVEEKSEELIQKAKELIKNTKERPIFEYLANEEVPKKSVDEKFEEFIKTIYERTVSHSLNGEEVPIQGELYVSHDEETKKKVKLSKKNIAALILGFGVLAAGLKIAGDMDFATKVRNEIVSQDDDFKKGDTFQDYANTLNDFELNQLYHDTAKEMKQEGFKEESRQMEAVVEQMIEDYEEKQEFHK